MVGVHVLIGIGEAVITALTVGAVIAVRPDLVYGARGLTQKLKLRVNGELVDAPGAEPEPARVAARTSHRKVWAAGLVTSLLLAGFVSFYASADPDGLEKVATDHGIDKKAEEHAVADSPLADYGVKDVDDARLSGGSRASSAWASRSSRAPACSGSCAAAVRTTPPRRTPPA